MKGKTAGGGEEEVKLRHPLLGITEAISKKGMIGEETPTKGMWQPGTATRRS